MFWIKRRGLYVLGAATLIGSALAIAADDPGPVGDDPGPVGDDPGPASKVEVSTIGSDPAVLTPAELEKLLEQELIRITPTEAVPDGSGPARAPVAAKSPEISTIVAGSPGLTALEIAKLQGETGSEAAQPPAAEPPAAEPPAAEPKGTDGQE